MMSGKARFRIVLTMTGYGKSEITVAADLARQPLAAER
jgi:hypothetical protein